jgi:hypothetical protein
VLMFVITMSVIVLLSGLVLLAVAQGEGKLEELMEDDRPAATLLNAKWRRRLRYVLSRVGRRPATSRASETADNSDGSHYASH